MTHSMNPPVNNHPSAQGGDEADLMDGTIRLAHGNGGLLMQELLQNLVFSRWEGVDTGRDATLLAVPPGARLAVTSDSFTVNPLFFPGGNIGSLAIHGTVNDLAVSGAEPHALTFNMILEEGLAIADLQRALAAADAALREAGVQVVAGDTKVVPKGQGSGMVFITTGLGWCPTPRQLHLGKVQAGDQILVSGAIGEHGTAVMLAREDFGMSSDLLSDAASVLPLTRAVWDLPGVRFMRDPTRGGLTSVLHEIRHATGLGVEVHEQQVPVRPEVQAVCEMLGFDAMSLACEGRVVAVVAPEVVDEVLARWQQCAQGQAAMRIGEINRSGQVILRTSLGGQRFLEPLEEEPLPRIC